MIHLSRFSPLLLFAALVLVLISQPGDEPSATEIFPYAEIRFGVDASYPPFSVATADDLFGLEIDLARALGERIGLPVRFVNLGFDGLFDALRTNQVDALISALPIDTARIGSVYYTQPYFDAGLVLVSDGTYPTMRDLSDHSLAYEYGSTAESEVRAWLRRIRPFDLLPYDTPAAALDAVRLGEANATAALVDSITARLYLRDHPDWNAEYTYVTNTLYAMVTGGDHPEIAARLDAALQTMFDDGTLIEIIDRWL